MIRRRQSEFHKTLVLPYSKDRPTAPALLPSAPEFQNAIVYDERPTIVPFKPDEQACPLALRQGSQLSQFMLIHICLLRHPKPALFLKISQTNR